MPLIILFIAGALVILLMTMAANLLIFPALKKDGLPREVPLVSILIPARNEATVIGKTIQSHLEQDYEHIELILLDDNSDDGTAEIALSAANGDERLRIIQGTALANGWVGKSWACQQLGEVAGGEILIFTDADVQWETSALNSLVAQLQSSKADMLTVWSTQITETYAERLTVPLMAMVILGYLPTVVVHYSPFSMFAAANGQVMAWRREAYEAIGGHQVVAQSVLDDVTLARAAKQHGFRIRMVDGNGQILARMYENWDSVRDGFAKNILAGYGSVLALILGTLFHWLVFLVPYFLLFMPEYWLMAVVMIMAGLSLRVVSAYFTKQRVIDAIGMPITVILFTVIAFQSIYWHYTGGPVWKGRKLGKSDPISTQS